MVMDDSEACSLPGGLASVKRQFESQEFGTSSSQSSVTQIHYQQRTVQEMSSSSEVTVRSSTGEFVPDASASSLSYNQQEVSHDQRAQHNNVTASYGNYYDETVMLVGGEDLPKVSTQALKQQYERSVEEAAPSKQIKVDVDFNQFQWTPVNQSFKGSAGTSYETSSTVKTDATTSSASSMAYETMENFPPPPSDLLEVTQEAPEYSVSPQPPDQHSQQKHSISKEEYFKQRSMAELKRLYKHINPEVRKNLEVDFMSQVTEAERAHLDSEEMVGGEVQQACYVFENDGSSPSKCMSPEREYLEWDEILKGEVQSMRWMFENKPLDTIKDDTPDEDDDRQNIAQQEIIAGKDVRRTAWMFETQPMGALGTDGCDSAEQSEKQRELARGDVRTATWLFETQPLDYLNKIYQEDEQALDVIVTKDIAGGDVKTARYLFETQHLDSLGKTETIEESNFLNLKSELEEIKGEVKTTTRMFETQPMCVIRGDSGEMLEITTIRREETEKGDVKTSRWMFETQPLAMINKDPSMVKLICGVSMEDNTQGGVNKGRWLFETKTLDTIKDEEWESSRNQREEILGADVRKHCLVFETQSMDTLKDNTNARPLPSEEIVGGDVRSATHLFETVPMEHLKDLAEVGKLQKMFASEEEKGDVRHQKWVFESQPLENIREEKKEITRTVNMEALDKGDVTNYKERFETLDLSKCEGAQKIQIEGVTSGSVKSNKVLFESTPMYAMQDSSGHYHEVKTVRREEVVKGDVRSCRWMFETRPIDEFDESINKFQIIKGISKQEIESGDVKTAKWLFETQALDAIKCVSEDEEHKTKESIEIERGDVKTCRWLFETQPMDVLYEKEEKSETDVQEVQRGDVKTCTWLFETQTLDNIRDHTDSESETILKTCTVDQEDIQGKDVGLARFLFETENLENLTGKDTSSFRRVTEIDIQSGDVSRMKFIFENRSSDIMTSTSGETMQQLKTRQAEDIQKGNVVNCTWMFENQPIDAIREETEEGKETRTVTDVQGGNVDKGRFIFETYSLDQIQEESTETEISKLNSIIREEIERGDVKNYTMMFENQPLYAIRDKEGHYHEVTTLTKEEIMRGDVVGARWLFETKPLDSIRDTEEVYVIKSVTEEDVNKGDVTSARWRFETQPLDEIAEDIKVRSKTVEDIRGGDVKMNKQHFETDKSNKYVRTVSVSEIQKGDVRSATWMFETHTIDKIHAEGSEYNEMDTVTKEEVMKGDVKQSVWLFEKEPLDRIKETDGTETAITKEEIPQADVKTTTWLFESTPFNAFNENSVEKTEILGKSIKGTLEELYSQKMVDSQGILIEADEIGDVRMAKYRLMNQDTPQIQKEEAIRGDLNNIMMNLLNRRESTEKGITIDKEERGNINTTVKRLLNPGKGVGVEKEEIIRGDIQEAINNLLKEEGSSKRGILIQEDEKGDVRMTIYSLLNKEEGASLEKEDIIQGNVSRTLHRLLSNPGAEDSKRIRVGDLERGNVSFYSTCIESGALDYLKQLQYESSDEAPEKGEKECIIGGDVEETKLILRRNSQQVGRTVAKDDILPGDVHNTVQVFMTEPAVTYRNLEKRDIVKGDLRGALDSLSQAANQKVVIEKEAVVKGDIPTTLRSLEDAQHQSKEMEKPEIVRGDIRGAMVSLEKSATAKAEVSVEDLVPGDIKGTLKSLEEATQAVKEVEKQEIVRGDIHIAMQSLHEASSDKKVYQHQVSEQGDVRGTIQLFMEPSTSPRMERRGSTEGDVKTSIKSLYEGQEQTQLEKEEVIKGDVQGAIKCLMQKKQYSNPKRMYSHKKARAPAKNPLPAKQEEHECSHVATNESVAVNPAPAVKNLPCSPESQRRIQKHAESKSVKTMTVNQEDHSLTAVRTANTSEASQQTHVKEQQAVRQKITPPQKMPAPKPVMIKKQMTNQQAESKDAIDVNVTKEVQNTSQTNVSTTHMHETKTIKQVQTTVSEHKTVTQKQNVTVAEHTAVSPKQQAAAAAVTEHAAVSQKQHTAAAVVMDRKAVSQKQHTAAAVIMDRKAVSQKQHAETAVVMDRKAVSQKQHTAAAVIMDHKAVSQKQHAEAAVIMDHKAVSQKQHAETAVVMDHKAALQKQNVTVAEHTTASQKKNVTVAEHKVASQKQNVTVAEHKVASQKQNVTVAEHKAASQKQNVTVAEHKAVSQKQHTGAAAVTEHTAFSQKQNVSVTEHTAFSQKQNVSVTEHTAFSQKQNVSVTEHTSFSQKQNAAAAAQKQQSVKNMKGGYCNLDMMGKGGMMKKGKPEINFPPPPFSPPPPSESELSLPPPPSPVAESPVSPMSHPCELPPPPPPMESDLEFFPPPPPPSLVGQDFLPPPPSQQELNAMPQQEPAKPGKAFGRPLFKIPKPPEPMMKQPTQVKPKWQKRQPTPQPSPPPPPPPPPVQPEMVPEQAMEQEVMKEVTMHAKANTQVQAETAVSTTATSPPGNVVAKPTQEEMPRPPKKVFVPPLKLPPTPEPAPEQKARPYARKFKTPLMLAEERFRLQRIEKEDTERSRVGTPTSPPAGMQTQPASPISSSGGSMFQKDEKSEVVMEATQAKVEEAETVTKEQPPPPPPPTPQERFTNRVPSHIPPSKPLISMVNKKSASGSANISLDKKHTSEQVTGKQHASSDINAQRQTASVSATHTPHEVTSVKVQSGSSVITSSVVEQQFIKKTSSQSISSTQSFVQEDLSLQSQAAVTLASEEGKHVNAPLTQGGKKTPSQPTKIPKVTPNFKVKTFRMPPGRKGETDTAGPKETAKSESHSQQQENETQKSEAAVIQESSQVTSTPREEKDVKATVNEERHESVQKKTKQVSKKESEVKQSPSFKIVSAPRESNRTVAMQAPQGQGHISVSHSHQSVSVEHVQKKEEVTVTESVVQQGFHRQEASGHAHKQQAKMLQHQQRAEINKMQAMQERSKCESMALSDASKVADAEEVHSSVESTYSERCEITQRLLVQIKDLQGTPSKIDSSAMTVLIGEVPDWVMGPDEKRNLGELVLKQGKKKLKEMIAYMRNIAQVKLTHLEENMRAAENQEKEAALTPPPPTPPMAPTPPTPPTAPTAPTPPTPPPVLPKPDKRVFSGATSKMSKINIGSSKVEMQRKVTEEKNTMHEVKVQQELSEAKNADQSVSSPLTSIRSPSPTYISIESVRRTDSPLRVTPSPPPYKCVGTPPPAPRKSHMAMSHLSRASPSPSPSPTLSRSEKLMKLKDTTTISRGMTPPPPMPLPEFFAELAAERELASPMSDRDICLDMSEQVDVTEMVDSMMTVRDKKSFFEEAQRAEVNRAYIRKDPIDIPERLGPDTEEHAETVQIDLLKEDLPRVDMSKLVNRFESPQPKVYARKDPIVITERLGSDTEDADAEPKTPKTDEMPTFIVKAIKDVFETGEHGSQAARELREHIERRESESSAVAEHTGHSATTSVSEQFHSVDDHGNVTSGTRETAAHSESSGGRGSPPSYADVVRGSASPEASTEELLRNFQQSWAESQGVFQSLGFSVVTHQQETVVTGKPDCAA